MRVLLPVSCVICGNCQPFSEMLAEQAILTRQVVGSSFSGCIKVIL